MFPALLEKLQRREDLTAAEAASAMARIMDGDAAAAHIAGLLVGAALRRASGQRSWSALRGRCAQRAVPLSRRYAGRLRHLRHRRRRRAGRSTSRPSSLWSSPPAALRVAKHGNRVVSSRCGSADVFEALGVNVSAPAGHRRALSRRSGRRVLLRARPSTHRCGMPAPVRRDLGVRTAFNLLGPLTNPAGAPRQLIGVPRPELTELVARALGLLGVRPRVWVVHGADGLDEISTTGYTKVSEARDGCVRHVLRAPGDVGLPKATTADLAGGDAAANADRLRRILAGEPGPAPRHRPVQRRRGAARRRRGRIGGRRHAPGRDGARRRRAAERLERLVQVSADEGSGV